ncbi:MULTISPECIES: SRPBCC domain-containing protein [unclassified Leucobacter]|uniref:SRPBCC domain-containing protein n=1 Tax=unclassified Leucobacter TaxID=2621730 RepID=UPI0006229F3B|nr:SRPBCC domain-containing protein [Leucobacter sp. Ag1]KKI21008.1 polyketide cyclase [Leucobacter sp. Ag1]
MSEEQRIVSAVGSTKAPAEVLFELIADPSQQPRWDGNDNLSEAAPGQRVHAVGDVFRMALTKAGAVRLNRIVEFEEGRRIAWKPAPEGEAEPGHLWRWELSPVEGGTLVRHTYDWTDLEDPKRQERARATTAENLQASIDRLTALAETGAAERSAS